MIPRLKRQTKKRHSVKRDWRHPSFLTATVTSVRIGNGPRIFATDCAITIQPIAESIIGARLSPDVWAP